MARAAGTRAAPAALALALALGSGAAPALAQSGGTLTPDQLTYVVNKDLAGERWTITLNLASLDPQRFISATGNVFRPGGGPPSFVWCQVRDDSTGTLADPTSVFRLRCQGTDACASTASGCARVEWRPVADLVEIPADFFLPPGGNGAAASGTAVVRDAARGPRTGTGEARDSPPATSAPPAWHPGAGAAPASLAGTHAGTGRGQGGATSRGTTLSPDTSNFLVSKDVGTDRWSISLNLVPAQAADDALATRDAGQLAERGFLERRRLSVTGNVFPPGGGEPSFVFCQERQDSAGQIADPASEFRFSCLGTGRCNGTAVACARGDWRPIPGGDDVRLAASFFLPPAGLPPTPASDAEIVIVGRTSDPPSLAAPAGVSALADGVAGGGCPSGAACALAIGGCPSVAGRLETATGGGCVCRVGDVPDECIVCGDGATGTCGGDCSFAVGGATARGTCLPFSAGSGACVCYAAAVAEGAEVALCGGALDALCPAGKCCTDDLRDGCDPARGDEDCSGICVDSAGCDPTVEICGSCLDQRAPVVSSCGSGVLLPGEDCCVAGGGCRDGGSFCFCEAGSVCVSDGAADLCCATNLPKLCPDRGCVPSDAQCCGERRYCTVGSVCTSDVAKCCPASLPQLCANGTDCVPDGAQCCDGGRFCDAGSVCTDVPGTCCPASLPQLCANGTDCVPAGAVCCGGGRFCPAGTMCEPFPGGVNCVPAAAGSSDGGAATVAAEVGRAGEAGDVLPAGGEEAGR